MHLTIIFDPQFQLIFHLYNNNAFQIGFFQQNGLKPFTLWPIKILRPSCLLFLFRHLFWFSILDCCSFCSKLELSPPHSMPGDRKSGQNLDPADQWLAPRWHPDDHGMVAFFRRSWRRWWWKLVVSLITFVVGVSMRMCFLVLMWMKINDNYRPKVCLVVIVI